MTTPITINRTCEECRFAVFEEHGYSNWTVEGSEFSCAKRMHPDGKFDRYYSANPKLNFAANCRGFEAGDCIDMDVEQENMDDLTPEQKIVWHLHNDIVEEGDQ